MKALRVALFGFGMFALALPVQAQKDNKKDNKKPDVIVEAEKALKPGQIAARRNPDEIRIVGPLQVRAADDDSMDTLERGPPLGA